jgi:hypothetical protein
LQVPTQTQRLCPFISTCGCHHRLQERWGPHDSFVMINFISRQPRVTAYDRPCFPLGLDRVARACFGCRGGPRPVVEANVRHKNWDEPEEPMKRERRDNPGLCHRKRVAKRWDNTLAPNVMAADFQINTNSCRPSFFSVSSCFFLTLLRIPCCAFFAV